MDELVINSSILWTLGALGTLTALAALVAMRGRGAGADSRPAHSLAALWLPLLITAPTALLALSLGDEINGQWGIWFIAGPATAGALLGLGIATWRRAAAEQHDARSAPNKTQAFMLGGLAVILGGLCWCNRLSFVHGQILITLGVVWMWACSVDRPHPGAVRASTSERPAGSTTSAGPVFVVDWAHRGGAPLAPVLLIVGCWAILLAAGRGIAGTAAAELTMGSAGVSTALTTVAACILLNARLAQRLCVSVSFLAVTLGLGALGLSLFPMNALLGRLAEVGVPVRVVIGQSEAVEGYGVGTLTPALLCLILLAAGLWAQGVTGRWGQRVCGCVLIGAGLWMGVAGFPPITARLSHAVGGLLEAGEKATLPEPPADPPVNPWG